jgi:plastocyanin
VTHSTRTRASIAGLTALVFAGVAVWPRPSIAADSDVEEVRRELRALQVQVQALRSAIAETAELDKQKAALLLRVLKNTATAADSAPASKAELPPAPAVTSTPSSRRAEAVASARKSAPPPPPAEPAVGLIRGKLTIPGGEPVAYVYVENVLAPPVRGQHATIEQSGKKFMPGWAVVQRGTNISFPNKDNIYHNVFSLSPGNSFDLGLYNAASEAKSHTFNEAGPVDVYCNIHPQMAASILVVPNRHYAKVKGDGSFELAGVPAGRRKVVAWAPGSKPTADWVDVSAGGAVDLNLRLDSKTSGHKNKVGQAYGSYE